MLAALAATASAAPSIVVAAPTPGAVARPGLTVQATCADPGGCLEFEARIGSATGPIVATGTDSIDQPIDLAAYDGQATALWLVAHDAAGQSTAVVVPIWIEASPVLTPVVSVVGEVLDVDATRVLYVDPAGVARVRVRADGSDSALGLVRAVRSGRLTSVGAVYASRDGAPGCATGEALYEWHGSGAPVEVDRACGAATTRWLVRGDWGARRDSPLDITRRDLRTGAETAVHLPMLASHGYSSVERFDLGDNGDVVAVLYLPGSSGGWSYIRDRAGVQTYQPLNTTSPTSPHAIATDGVGWAVFECTNVGFACDVYRCLSPGVDCVAAFGVQNLGAHWGLMMAGGWLYVGYHVLGTPALGRLAPSGASAQVGGAGDEFEAVSTFGAATLQRTSGRALLDVAGAVQPIGSNLGRGLFIGSDACVAIGGTVFVVALPTGAKQRAPAAVAPPTSATSGGCDAGSGGSGGSALIALSVVAALAWRRRRGWLALLLAAGACGDGLRAIDAATVDAGVVDGALIDATAIDAAGVDATTPDAVDVDAQVVDAAVVDAQVVDAQVVDARVVDGRVVDAQVVDARVIDAAVLDAAVFDAAPLDAASPDAVPVDATPTDAPPGGPWPGCTVDRRVDIGGAGLPAADIVAVDTGADLLLLFTDGPAGAAAPLRWTRLSYSGDRLAGPTLLTATARAPHLVVRDEHAMASYLVDAAAWLQPFTASGPLGAPVAYSGYASLTALAPGLSDGFRVVSMTTFGSNGLDSVVPLRRDGSLVFHPGVVPQSIAALAITQVSLHTDGRLVATVVRPHALPGCAACTSVGVADLGHHDSIATVVEPTLPAGRVATARALTHRGTTYLTWIEANPDGTAPTGAIVRYPLDVVATVPDAVALTIVATGNGVGVVGFQDAAGVGLRRFTDDLAGFALGPTCSLDLVPDQLVRIDADTVLVLDAAGHARIVTIAP